MSIALFAHPSVFTSLQNLFRWLTNGLTFVPSGKSTQSPGNRYQHNNNPSKGIGNGNDDGIGSGRLVVKPAAQTIAKFDRCAGTSTSNGYQMAQNRSPRALRVVRLFEPNPSTSQRRPDGHKRSHG